MAHVTKKVILDDEAFRKLLKAQGQISVWLTPANLPGGDTGAVEISIDPELDFATLSDIVDEAWIDAPIDDDCEDEKP